MDDREIKAKLLPEFKRDFEKYYPAGSLKKLGFNRRLCSKCGRGFWSLLERDFCDEPACSGGYRFIGERLTRKEFGYREAWNTYVDVFTKWGYVPLERYPVVSRWYDELYFVSAGINDFQPYVVSGEVPPPADCVLEPQFCLRFNDLGNLGVPERCYSAFTMVGQHTFRTREKPDVYFKEEGILQMHEFLTGKNGLGIPPEEIFYHEDVWAGGGNFGPCIEFFSRGLELGNQVYMQYRHTPSGYEELPTQVIDMGAGLERWSWFSQGLPMSYDSTFPRVMEHLYRATGVPRESELVTCFSRWAGLLGFEDRGGDGTWETAAGECGVGTGELKAEVMRRRDLYALGDHTRALLVAVADGSLPGNVGGGYNLRNLLRRCWAIIDRWGYELELEKILELHMGEFGEWFTELREPGSLFDIVAVEHDRYVEQRRKSRELLQKMVGKGQKIDSDKLVELYDSQGVTPELIGELAPDVEVPSDFYARVQARHEKPERERTTPYPFEKDDGVPRTVLLYYDPAWLKKSTFSAKVVWQKEKELVLDRTLFYPTGGGQLHDIGVIDDVRVTEVVNAGGVVVHRMEKSLKVKKGASVNGVVDVERRMALRRHHTAAHASNYAAREVLGPHVWQAGAEKTPDKARLDVTHYRGLSFEELATIERLANELVMKSLPVNVEVLPRNEAERRYGMRIYQGGAVPGLKLRIVSIGDDDAYDVEACGGLHVNNTSEIGVINLTSSERISDGVVRLEFTAGMPAVSDLQNYKSMLQELSQCWGVGYADLPKTGERFFKEWKERGKRVAEVEEALVEQVLQARLSGPDLMVQVELPISDVGVTMRAIAKLKSQFGERTVVVLGDNFAYAFSVHADASEILRGFCDRVQGDENEARGFALKKRKKGN